MKSFRQISLFLTMVSPLISAVDPSEPLKNQLDPKVYEVPTIHRVPNQDVGSIKAFFYETLDYKGQPTRAFAYLGIPESESPVPAMVLIHGGGGTAFDEWVKIWNDRGYAAVSMSLEGHMPDENGKGKLRHDYSGPVRAGMFNDSAKAIEEQWMYHAVSNVMLAHSLLRSLPQVDADRIGMTGISWGGVLTSLISGVDQRFKCAIPVYGAGFLSESVGHFKNTNTELKQRWDPSKQFLRGSMPTLWVNGDCDAHFSVNITSRSHEATMDRSNMVIHPSMPHGHPPGWNPQRVPEIYAFADSILKSEGPGLGRITEQPEGLKSVVRYESETPIVEAKVYYLSEPLTYRKEKPEDRHPGPGEWSVLEAGLDARSQSVSFDLPEDVKTFYVNLKDANGHIFSSVLVSLQAR